MIGMLEIHPGDYVKVEETRGLSTGAPVTQTVEGRAYRDEEGIMRVDGVNVQRDADGYFARGIVLLSHQAQGGTR